MTPEGLEPVTTSRTVLAGLTIKSHQVGFLLKNWVIRSKRKNPHKEGLVTPTGLEPVTTSRMFPAGLTIKSHSNSFYIGSPIHLGD